MCWDVILTAASSEMYRVLVDAQSGAIVLRRCLTAYINDVSYRVFTSDSPSPLSPGPPTPPTDQPPLVARTLLTLPASTPTLRQAAGSTTVSALEKSTPTGFRTLLRPRTGALRAPAFAAQAIIRTALRYSPEFL